MKNIYQTISDVMAEIGFIGKDTKNQMQGFMYRGIDAVMNALNPALIKHKLFIVPEVLEQTREERQNSKGTTLIYSICKVKYTFYAEDGSSVSAIVIGEGMDSGDKATNKAMSIAFKYACFQVFCIPTEEMVDPDAECHEVAPKKKQSEEIEMATVDQISELKKKMKADGITPDFILNSYKIKDFKQFTKVMYDNVIKNWDKVVEKFNKD